jgi:hypothetical protein
MQTMALSELTTILARAADLSQAAIVSLERVKPFLDDLPPDVAQAWYRARRACDQLYDIATRAPDDGTAP